LQWLHDLESVGGLYTENDFRRPIVTTLFCNMAYSSLSVPDTAYVLKNACSLILDGVPFYELARASSMAVLSIRAH
jgi:hypothetical protein